MAHILLLEPDSLLAGSLSQFFANANHSVSVHSDPQAAVTAADSQKPDIIITELQLAGRSGVEFLYEFRSYPDWQAIPIIVFTNLHPEQTKIYQEVLNELGISGCLHKTGSGLPELLKLVHSYLPEYAQV